MGVVNLKQGNPMIRYYSKLFDEILDNEIIDYGSRGKLKIEYTFKHHFRILLEKKIDIQCLKCWSFNHKSTSHMGNLNNYGNPFKCYRHIPILKVQDIDQKLRKLAHNESLYMYYCPYGKKGFEYNKQGQTEFFKHMIEMHEKETKKVDEAYGVSGLIEGICRTSSK